MRHTAFGPIVSMDKRQVNDVLLQTLMFFEFQIVAIIVDLLEGINQASATVVGHDSSASLPYTDDPSKPGQR